VSGRIWVVSAFAIVVAASNSSTIVNSGSRLLRNLRPGRAWREHVAYDKSLSAWIVEVTSESRQPLQCTLEVSGPSVTKSQGPISAKFSFVLAPYPGQGLPVSRRHEIRNISELDDQLDCHEYRAK
jgi:hypothetical protein